jgi:peptide/nickel transport system substrate-binding protein
MRVSDRRAVRLNGLGHSSGPSSAAASLRPGIRLVTLLPLLTILGASACRSASPADPGVIVATLASAPTTLDPRLAVDDVSQKAAQLIFSNLLEVDDQLQFTGGLTETLAQSDPTTWIVTLRRGVRFHDGHELTADDVVYTFRCFLDPDFVSPKKGTFRDVRSVEAVDRHTVVFRLTRPFASFPSTLVTGVVPNGSGARLGDRLIGTGPYRFVRYVADDRIELAAFDDYFGGRPRNSGVVLKVVPDDVMRGLELRKGTVDVVVNDLAPDTVHQLRSERQLQVVEAPGVDYQYVGLNTRDPVLRRVEVRQALAHAVDRQAIVDYLRRGLARPASALLPPLSWASTHDVPDFAHDPGRARALLDAAGYPDPDGDGPGVRFQLTLKVSNNEPYRLQAAVLQHQMREVGVDVSIRSYEFATLYADVLAGNFQLFTLQWTGGSLADPDILRRVFHTSQSPPVGFNRGYFSNPAVDRLLDAAVEESDLERRRALYAEAQRLLAHDVPYISLWFKTNVAVAQRSLRGVRVSPLADFVFLKDVARAHL